MPTRGAGKNLDEGPTKAKSFVGKGPRLPRLTPRALAARQSSLGARADVAALLLGERDEDMQDPAPPGERRGDGGFLRDNADAS